MQKRRRYISAQKREKRPRINDEIRAPEVLLVDDEGETETLQLEQALARAREEELDLIEISPKAKPPVVKIDDFGRYQYQAKKKEQKQKSHSKQTEVKTLRFSFRTERHDLERIISHAKDFFGDRHLVKLVVRLRGREFTNKAYAKDKLMGLVKEMADIAEVEQPMKAQGNQFIVILRAKRGGKESKPSEGEAAKVEKEEQKT